MHPETIKNNMNFFTNNLHETKKTLILSRRLRVKRPRTSFLP